MNKEFIPYEEALKLKELGFDKCCLGYYVGGVLGQFKPASFYEISEDEIVKAPLYQQAFRWFREKYQLDYWVRAWWEYDRTMFIGYETLVEKEEHCGTYRTYEQAELACLKKLIEIVKNK